AVCGVTGIGLRSGEAATEVEPIELVFDGELTPERVLGSDLDAVADAVSTFSSGQRAATADAIDNPTGRRGGGADQTGQFPSERPGDPDEPDSQGLRDDRDAVPG